MFVFRWFGVIVGSACTLLDTQSRMDAWLLGRRHAQGEWQETEEDW